MQIDCQLEAQERAKIVLAPLTAPNGRKRARSKVAQMVRKFHLVVGILFTLNFLFLVATGFLVQHRELFQLEAKAIDRKWLPSGYWPGDPDSAIRADIVLTDLHSGKIFGPKGPLLVDAAAGAWLLMMVSGYVVQLASRYRNNHR